MKNIVKSSLINVRDELNEILLKNNILWFDEINILRENENLKAGGDKNLRTEENNNLRIEMFKLLEEKITTFFYSQRKEFETNSNKIDYSDELLNIYYLISDTFGRNEWSDKRAIRFSKYIQNSTINYLNNNNSKCFSTERIINIARTETNALVNSYTHFNLIKRGAKYHKWVSFNDEKVRHTHIIAHNQVKPINEPFIVGGYKMMFPLDDSLGASANEIINCRCIEVISNGF